MGLFFETITDLSTVVKHKTYYKPKNFKSLYSKAFFENLLNKWSIFASMAKMMTKTIR